MNALAERLLAVTWALSDTARRITQWAIAVPASAAAESPRAPLARALNELARRPTPENVMEVAFSAAYLKSVHGADAAQGVAEDLHRISDASISHEDGMDDDPDNHAVAAWLDAAADLVSETREFPDPPPAWGRT